MKSNFSQKHNGMFREIHEKIGLIPAREYNILLL